jgi:hypothetical protein
MPDGSGNLVRDADSGGSYRDGKKARENVTRQRLRSDKRATGGRVKSPALFLLDISGIP